VPQALSKRQAPKSRFEGVFVSKPEEQKAVRQLIQTLPFMTAM
jgi:hypothetical protein